MTLSTITRSMTSFNKILLYVSEGPAFALCICVNILTLSHLQMETYTFERVNATIQNDEHSTLQKNWFIFSAWNISSSTDSHIYEDNNNNNNITLLITLQTTQFWLKQCWQTNQELLVLQHGHDPSPASHTPTNNADCVWWGQVSAAPSGCPQTL